MADKLDFLDVSRTGLSKLQVLLIEMQVQLSSSSLSSYLLVVVLLCVGLSFTVYARVVIVSVKFGQAFVWLTVQNLAMHANV